MTVPFRSSSEVLEAPRAWVVAVGRAGALLLRILVTSVVPRMLLFEHTAVVGFDHLVEELAEDFLGANRKCLLPSPGQSDEFYASVFGHDILLDKLVL